MTRRRRSERIHAAIAKPSSAARGKPYADYIGSFCATGTITPEPARSSRPGSGIPDLIQQLFEIGVASGELRSDLDTHLAALAFLGLLQRRDHQSIAPGRDEHRTDHRRICRHSVARHDEGRKTSEAQMSQARSGPMQAARPFRSIARFRHTRASVRFRNRGNSRTGSTRACPGRDIATSATGRRCRRCVSGPRRAGILLFHRGQQLRQVRPG